MTMIVTVSGRLLEIKEYERDLSQNSRPRRKRKAYTYARDHRIRVYSDADIKRKKKSFERLVLANLVGDHAPALVTATMFEVGTIKSAYETFTLFIQRLRKSFGKDFRYIAVPEYQKRGAVHFHMMIWGIPEEYIKNEAPHWEREEDIGNMDKVVRGTRDLQNLWQGGYLDCISTDGSQKLGRYLGKYLSKSLQDPRLYSQKSYRASSNVLRSVRIPYSQAVGYAKEIWDLDLSTAAPLCDFETVGQWTGKGRYRAYQISLNSNKNGNKN